MAITLAAEGLSDAQITDGIARDDISSAARLWVRLWPTALNAAREVADPAEVPGLAAKALIGTIAVIAVGRGPREDVKSFLRAAVRELRDDSGSPLRRHPGAWSPEVSTSPIMSVAFARLPDLVQDLLWITVVGDRADELIAEALDISTTAAAAVRIDALTTLQREHLAAHADRAEDVACHLAHGALARAVEDPGAAGLSRETWMHLSECAWCTEAFHELVFSNAAIGALVDRAAAASPAVPPTVVGPELEAAESGVLVEPEVLEPVILEPEILEPVILEPEILEPEIVEPEVVGPEILDPVILEAALLDPPADPLPGRGTHAAVASSAGVVRRRGLVMSGAAAAVAFVAAVAIFVAGHDSDRTDPLEVAGPPTATPSSAVAPALSGASPSLASTAGVTAVPGTTPGTTIDAQPSATSTPRAPKSRNATSSSPTPTPTSQPSPTTPSSGPAETPTPTPTPPPTSPTSSPTPTPTPAPCSVLEHLLGLC